MKKILYLFFVVFTLQLSAKASQIEINSGSENDTSFIIRYAENFENEGEITCHETLPPKVSRLSSKSASIYVMGDNLPEDVLRCAKYATSVWEGIIGNPISFQIEIKWEDIDYDILTEIIYDRGEDGVFYPRSLIDVQSPNYDDIDLRSGTLCINKNTEWDYCVNENIDSTKKNLTYAILRGIGRIMGFGSSVRINEKGEYYYDNKFGYSNFDKLINSDDGEKLANIPLFPISNNLKLKDYITKENRKFFISDGNKKIELAEGPFSVENAPLCSLKEGLMKKGIATGEVFLNVDDNLWEALKLVGWDIRLNNSSEIICDDANSNGILSAYASHRFRLNNFNNETTNLEWTFNIPLKNGDFLTIHLENNNGECIIPPLENNLDYALTVDGLIRCRLDCSYMNNGIKYKLPSYTIFWEIKPRILDVQIVDIEFSDDMNLFRAEYIAKYLGAEKIKVYKEDEFGGGSTVKIYNEPSVIKAKTEWIFTGGYSWVNFIASNDTGNAYYVIEIEPYANSWYPLEDPDQYFEPKRSGKTDIISDLNDFSGVSNLLISLYNIDGKIIKEANSMEEFNKLILDPGLYILKITEQNTNKTVIKKIMR